MSNRSFFFFLAGALFGIPLTITYNRMVKECNERAPASEYISEYFGYPGKDLKVFVLYRKYCPAGRLHIVFLILSLLTAGCVIAAIWLA